MKTKITLEEFLSLFDFYFYTPLEKDRGGGTWKEQNSTTVRIFWNNSCDSWGEIGVSASGGGKVTEENLAFLVNPKLLSSEVDYFRVDGDLDILCVYLKQDDKDDF